MLRHLPSFFTEAGKRGRRKERLFKNLRMMAGGEKEEEEAGKHS